MFIWWVLFCIKVRLLTQAISYPWLKLVIFGLSLMMLKSLIFSLTISVTLILFIYYLTNEAHDGNIQGTFGWSQYMPTVEYVEEKASKLHIQHVPPEDIIPLLTFHRAQSQNEYPQHDAYPSLISRHAWSILFIIHYVFILQGKCLGEDKTLECWYLSIV